MTKLLLVTSYHVTDRAVACEVASDDEALQIARELFRLDLENFEKRDPENYDFARESYPHPSKATLGDVHQWFEGVYWFEIVEVASPMELLAEWESKYKESATPATPAVQQDDDLDG